MASSRETVFDDLQRIVGELEGIARGAAHAAGERMDDAASGLKQNYEAARDRLSHAGEAACSHVRRGLHAADRRVRRAPWESIGAVAAIAFIAGLLIGRRD